MSQQNDNVASQLVEAVEVTGTIKTALAQVKAQNDYLQSLVEKLEKLVAGSR